jgi:hypothetical protein
MLARLQSVGTQYHCSSGLDLVLISLTLVPTNSSRLAESARSIPRTAVESVKYLTSLNPSQMAAFTF